MAIVDKIESIKTHLGEAYSSLEEKGATLPTNKNIENLADSILSVPSGGGDVSEYFNDNFQADSSSSFLNTGYWVNLVKKLPSTPITVNSGNGYGLFYNYKGDIDLKKVIFSSAMSEIGSMFQNCTELTKVDFSNMDMRYISGMRNLFNNTPKLKTIIWNSNLDTSRVGNMGYMFANSGIETVDLSNFSYDNCSIMYYMFQSSQIYNIDFSNKLLPKLNNLTYFALSCPNLTSISFKNCDLSLVQDMSSLANNCANLENVDLSGVKFNALTRFASGFTACRKLKRVDFTGTTFGNSDLTGEYMFQNCDSLEYDGVKTLDTSRFKNFNYMFSGSGTSGINTNKVKRLDLSGWNTSRVTQFQSVFMNCVELTDLDMTGWDFSNASTLSSVFQGDFELQEIKGMDTWTGGNKITSLASMFYNCRKLKRIDLSNMDLSNITNIGNFVNGCYVLEYLDMSSLVGSKFSVSSTVFSGCGRNLPTGQKTMVYVKDTTAQTKVLNYTSSLGWTTANVIVAGSAEDTR